MDNFTNEWVVSTDENGDWIVKCCVCGDVDSAWNKPNMTGKWYCRGECYNSLWDTCEGCGGGAYIPEKKEGLCRKCYMEKHGLGIRVISMRFTQYD